MLALAPLAEEGLLAEVFVAAMQGTSGYGRSSDDTVHFSAMTENAFPYKTEGHRHRPEIEQELAALGARRRSPSSPTCCRSTRASWRPASRTLSEPTSKEAVAASTASATPTSPSSTSSTGPPNLRALRDTNECHVYVTVEERGRVIAFSAIDNIWKGASGQGVQNLNLMLGLDETEGLLTSERTAGHLLSLALGRGAGRRRGARPRPARARLPRRRRPLRAQGRRRAPTSACSSATPRRSPRRWS